MDVTLNRKALREALSALKPCLPPKPLTEFEANMLIRVTPDGVARVVATDMLQEGTICLPLLQPVQGTLEVVPDIKKLEKVITKSDTEDIVLSYEEGSGTLRVSSGSGFVDVPTLSASKMNRYDFPTSTGEPVGSVPALVLGEALGFIENFLPEAITGNMKFEVATLKGGMLTGANGWNRRGYLVCQALRLSQEIKFLQRFVSTMPKILKAVGGVLDVTLYERAIVMQSPTGFRYSCVRARHETPEPVLSYLKSSGPYLTLETSKLIKVLDKVVVPDYQSAGAPVGVEVTVSPADEAKKACLGLRLVSAGAMQAQDSIPCVREAEEGPGVPVEKVIDYRMFKALASELKAAAENRIYMSDPDSRFFKFQSKFSVGEHACVAVSVGSYSKKVGNAAR